MDKVDPKTGERWRKVPKVYERSWFSTGLLLACMVLGGWLCWLLNQHGSMLSQAEGLRLLDLATHWMAGHGYSLKVAAGQSIPEISTPPLVPLVVVGLMALKGTTQPNLVLSWLQWTNLGLYGLSVWLAFQVFQQHIRKPYPHILTVLYALSPVVLLITGSLTATLPYLVLSLAALLMLDNRFADKAKKLTPGSRMSLLLLCALALACHPAGLALVCALLYMLFRWQGTRKGLMYTGVFLLLLAPWFLRAVYYDKMSVTVPHQQLAQMNERRLKPEALVTDEPEIRQQLMLAVNSLARETLGTETRQSQPVQNSLWSSIWTLDFRVSSVGWVCWVLAGLFLMGWAMAFFTKAGSVGVYLTVWMAGTILLGLGGDPNQWTAVFPLLLLCVFKAYVRLCEWLKQLKLPALDVAVPALVLLILMNSTGSYLDLLRGSRLTQAYQRADDRVAGKQSGYWRALQWIQAYTPNQARIAAADPTSAQLYTERPTIPYPPKTNLKHMFQQMSRADYVLEDLQKPQTRETVSPVIAANPEGFRLVYTDPAAALRIWKVQH
ncbi:MAG: hypothetical protein SFZ03_09995 [Candidatus Melainabacteria bacterium]|nr:hypothetical protein [Candidatus Melainabacteria bacterium]